MAIIASPVWVIIAGQFTVSAQKSASSVLALAWLNKSPKPLYKP